MNGEIVNSYANILGIFIVVYLVFFIYLYREYKEIKKRVDEEYYNG